MIPMIVLGPKVEVRACRSSWSASASTGVLAEGQPLDILVTARAKTPVKEEMLFQLQVDAGLDDIQPRKEVFSGTEHEYRDPVDAEGRLAYRRKSRRPGRSSSR